MSGETSPFRHSAPSEDTKNLRHDGKGGASWKDLAVGEGELDEREVPGRSIINGAINSDSRIGQIATVTQAIAPMLATIICAWPGTTRSPTLAHRLSSTPHAPHAALARLL